MRFTGSEIIRDPDDCARELYRATLFIGHGPSANLKGVEWLLSEAELEVLYEKEQREAEWEEYGRQEEIEDFKRQLIEDEIMSGTYEVHWP